MKFRKAFIAIGVLIIGGCLLYFWANPIGEDRKPVINNSADDEAAGDNEKEVESPSPGPLKSQQQEVQLSEEEITKLSSLIKWIYDINLIYDGNDGETIQLPDEIKLLPTDTDKMRFVIDTIVFENILPAAKTDPMTYTFTAEEADAIISSAVGEKFAEHKMSEYVSDYKDGTYSYSMIGADGATWWPEIEIEHVTETSEEEIKITGVLKSVHDVFTEVYSYQFEASALRNPDSMFGGFTLNSLSIYQ
jgi:hypothetical protein